MSSERKIEVMHTWGTGAQMFREIQGRSSSVVNRSHYDSGMDYRALHGGAARSVFGMLGDSLSSLFATKQAASVAAPTPDIATPDATVKSDAKIWL